jgi:hypothetical protein
MPNWCGTRGANAAGLTAPAPTGSWCATGCRCLNHATSSSLSTFSRNCRSGSASAIDGFTEREVYREFYPRGLTALDDLDEALGTRPSMGHLMAREGEVKVIPCERPEDIIERR